MSLIRVAGAVLGVVMIALGISHVVEAIEPGSTAKPGPDPEPSKPEPTADPAPAADPGTPEPAADPLQDGAHVPEESDQVQE